MSDIVFTEERKVEKKKYFHFDSILLLLHLFVSYIYKMEHKKQQIIFVLYDSGTWPDNATSP